MIILRQRGFSHADFNGLTEEGKKRYKELRSGLVPKFKAIREEINRKHAKKIEDIEAMYEKGSKQYNKAMNDAVKTWKDELKSAEDQLKTQKYGIKNHLHENRSKDNTKEIDRMVDSFKDSAKKQSESTKKKLGEKASELLKKGGEFAKKNKKGLIISSSVVAASGAGYGIYKGVKSHREENDLKKKVRGYEK